MAPSSFRSLTLAVLFIVLSTTQLTSSLGAAYSGNHDLLMLDRFHRWMSTHGRTYGSADEKLHRFEVYCRNVEFIDSSNRDAGVLGYELGENQFTDLTNAEFVSVYANGGPPPQFTDLTNAEFVSVYANGAPPSQFTDDDNAIADGDDMVITTLAGNISEGHGSNALPVIFDWRAKGAVTPIKNQGPCGSCWAFSVVATVESLVKRKGGPLLDLSEQELVDCDKGDAGCKGGWPKTALDWIKTHGGLVSETAYKYTAKDGPCKNTKGLPRAGQITGVKQVLPSLSELALQSAVLGTPVSVALDGGGALQHYKSGVYNGPCTTAVNHAVVFVGWGVDKAGVKYWIVKNSWGTSWGQAGYFFIRREASGPTGPGLCGLATAAFYPV